MLHASGNCAVGHLGGVAAQRSEPAVTPRDGGSAWTRIADGPTFHARPGVERSYWTTVMGLAVGPDIVVEVAVGLRSDDDAPGALPGSAWWRTLP